MKKLFEVKSPDQMQSGLFVDIAKNQDALWLDGENIWFGDGSVEKRKGATSFFTATWEPDDAFGDPAYVTSFAQQYISPDLPSISSLPVKRIYINKGTSPFSGIARIGYIDEQTGWTYNDITPQSGGAKLNFAFSSLHGYPVRHLPWGKLWQGVLGFGGVGSYAHNWAGEPANAVANPNTSTVATAWNIMKLHYNHTFLYTDKYVTWSSADGIDLDFGDNYLRILDSAIRSVQPIADAMAIYAADSVIIQRYVGAPFYFAFSTSPINGIGAHSDEAVVQVARLNYGWGPKGFWKFDGISWAYIDSPQIHRHVISLLDPVKTLSIVGTNFAEKQTVKWWFDALDGSRRCVSYNYGNNTWSKEKGLDIQFAQERKFFNSPIGAFGTKLGWLDSSNDDDGVAINAWLRSHPLSVGERERYKDWQMIRVDRKNSENIGAMEFRFGYSNVAEYDEAISDADLGGIEWTAWTQLDYEVWPPARESVYLTVEFRSITLGAYWRLGGFSLHGEMGGLL